MIIQVATVFALLGAAATPAGSGWVETASAGAAVDVQLLAAKPRPKPPKCNPKRDPFCSRI
jgi:hypothetical protein